MCNHLPCSRNNILANLYYCLLKIVPKAVGVFYDLHFLDDILITGSDYHHLVPLITYVKMNMKMKIEYLSERKNIQHLQNGH
jgi:hypothetical protein